MRLCFITQQSSSSGHVATIRVLLRHRASVNAVDINGHTPLHLSAMYGLADVSDVLIKHGADVHARNKELSTPLHKAAERHIGAYQYPYGAAELLIRSGADVNALNENIGTPLHVAALHGRLNIMQLLILHGANVNSNCVSGRTALHMAVSRSYDQCVRLLCRSNADVNAKTNATNSVPLFFACVRRDRTTIRVLLWYVQVHITFPSQNSPQRTIQLRC